MGLAHCSGSQAGIIQAQGYLIILVGDFNQVLLIENKQMFSHYSTGIIRNLTHEFPNYTAPFWKSVGIQTLSVIQYTISFGSIEALYRVRKFFNVLRLKLNFT